MPTKIFTTISGPCPFGTGCDIDSTKCRQCQWYFRMGTGTFFWCNHPGGREQEQTKEPEKTKRGRPRKNGPKKPVKRTKKKNG